MRWLLCFLLVTLITLLRADASSVTKASTAKTNAKLKAFIDHGATGRVFLNTHSPNSKRNLRGENKKTTIIDPSSQQPVIGEEERSISVRFNTGVNEFLRMGKEKAMNYLFKEAHALGETPESLKNAYYGTRTREEASNTWFGKALTNYAEKTTDDYKVWLDKIGEVPK
ncbi:RxLR effector protein [Phytophthora megakarya]|uniref:RxLR effector protein n=1 Tax=Phytophthora megakarya TaxID=4795 RepID=A0A225V129_9STRA|nr:RxLR effector protein [Phytophthora megakarya]